MSAIRVTYSGLISLIVGLSSLITGTVFTIIVTRSLSPEEFGTWGLIGGLLAYVLIGEPIISYWVTREVAREEKSGKTAILSSGIFSFVAVFVYIIIAYFVALGTDANQEVLLFALILIPLMFLHKTLIAISLGWKPQSSSFAILVFEILKIPSALLFVYFLDFSIYGAIISTAVSYGGSIIVLIMYSKEKIKNKIDFIYIKKWIKFSWLPLYPGIGVVIFTLDVTVFVVITGSVEGLAYYTAALAIASFVAHSGLVSQALYAKFLRGGKREYLQENLIRFFYFSLPLSALSIILAKPALFTLNPLYEIAAPVVIFLTLRAFFYTLSKILEQALKGIETVDAKANATFKVFIKSKLFVVPTIRLMKFSCYTVSLIIIFMLMKNSLDQIELVISWSIISFIIEIPFIVYLYSLTKKNFLLKVPPLPIMKYGLTCIGVFSITFLLMEEYLIYENTIFTFLPTLLLYVILGGLSYIGITYLIDYRTRQLVKSIIQEIKTKHSST